jgi:hypothetical protein
MSDAIQILLQRSAHTRSLALTSPQSWHQGCQHACDTVACGTVADDRPSKILDRLGFAANRVETASCASDLALSGYERCHPNLVAKICTHLFPRIDITVLASRVSACMSHSSLHGTVADDRSSKISLTSGLGSRQF